VARRTWLLVPVGAVLCAVVAVFLATRIGVRPVVQHSGSTTDRSVEYLVVRLDPGTTTDRAARIVQDAITLPGGQTGTNMLLGRDVFVDFATLQTNADIAGEERALLDMKSVASVTLVHGQDPGVVCYGAASDNGVVCRHGAIGAG
jgi:hypothetical protein